MTTTEQNTFLDAAYALLPAGVERPALTRSRDSFWVINFGAASCKNADLLTALLLFGTQNKSAENLVGTPVQPANFGSYTNVAAALATTGNVALTGEQTIDGTLTSATRLLVKSNTTASQNGIYVTAAGAWARATDYNEAAEIQTSLVTVSGGTLNAGTQWIQTATTVVVGTTLLTFSAWGLGTRWNAFINYLAAALA